MLIKPHSLCNINLVHSLVLQACIAFGAKNERMEATIVIVISSPSDKHLKGLRDSVSTSWSIIKERLFNVGSIRSSLEIVEVKMDIGWHFRQYFINRDGS